MTPFLPADFAGFARRYRLAGARLRRVKLTFGTSPTLELVIATHEIAKQLGTDPRPVRLRLVLSEVEEFRFQKRPTVPAGRIPDARFGQFDGLYFVTLDAYGLDPGDRPKPHDFRASDAYAAGKRLTWEEIPPKPKG